MGWNAWERTGAGRAHAVIDPFTKRWHHVAHLLSHSRVRELGDDALADCHCLAPHVILYCELEANTQVVALLANDTSSDLLELFDLVRTQVLIELLEQLHRFIELIAL